MTSPIVVRQHIEEVSTRWWRRAPTYLSSERTFFSELAEFDESIDAHLDALVEAGQTGLTSVTAALMHDTPDAAADIFAALALALQQDNKAAFFNIIEKTSAHPQFSSALHGAFGWIETPVVIELIKQQQTMIDSIFTDAALAHCHTHDLTGGNCLQIALDTGEARAISRAFKTVGECGRLDLLPIIKTWIENETVTHLASDYYAARAGLLLDRLPQAIRVLAPAFTQPHPFRHEAIKLLCVALPIEQLCPLIEPLSDSPDTIPLAIKAAGWSGSPNYIPWLAERMDDPALAILAGESIRMITGFDCEIAVSETTTATADRLVDIDDTRPPKHPALAPKQVTEWWNDHKSGFHGKRFLLGRPIVLDWVNTILAEGEQVYRELASLHRIIQLPGSKLFPTRVNARIQWHRILQF